MFPGMDTDSEDDDFFHTIPDSLREKKMGGRFSQLTQSWTGSPEKVSDHDVPSDRSRDTVRGTTSRNSARPAKRGGSQVSSQRNSKDTNSRARNGPSSRRNVTKTSAAVSSRHATDYESVSDHDVPSDRSRDTVRGTTSRNSARPAKRGGSQVSSQRNSKDTNSRARNGPSSRRNVTKTSAAVSSRHATDYEFGDDSHSALSPRSLKRKRLETVGTSNSSDDATSAGGEVTTVPETSCPETVSETEGSSDNGRRNKTLRSSSKKGDGGRAASKNSSKAGSQKPSRPKAGTKGKSKTTVPVSFSIEPLSPGADLDDGNAYDSDDYILFSYPSSSSTTLSRKSIRMQNRSAEDKAKSSSKQREVVCDSDFSTCEENEDDFSLPAVSGPKRRKITRSQTSASSTSKTEQNDASSDKTGKGKSKKLKTKQLSHSYDSSSSQADIESPDSEVETGASTKTQKRSDHKVSATTTSAASDPSSPILPSTRQSRGQYGTLRDTVQSADSVGCTESSQKDADVTPSLHANSLEMEQEKYDDETLEYTQMSQSLFEEDVGQHCLPKISTTPVSSDKLQATSHSNKDTDFFERRDGSSGNPSSVARQSKTVSETKYQQHGEEVVSSGKRSRSVSNDSGHSSALDGDNVAHASRSTSFESDLTQPYQSEDEESTQVPPSLVTIPSIPSLIRKQESGQSLPPPLLSKVSSFAEESVDSSSSVIWPALSKTNLGIAEKSMLGPDGECTGGRTSLVGGSNDLNDAAARLKGDTGKKEHGDNTCDSLDSWVNSQLLFEDLPGKMSEDIDSEVYPKIDDADRMRPQTSSFQILEADPANAGSAPEVRKEENEASVPVSSTEVSSTTTKEVQSTSSNCTIFVKDLNHEERNSDHTEESSRPCYTEEDDVVMVFDSDEEEAFSSFTQVQIKDEPDSSGEEHGEEDFGSREKTDPALSGDDDTKIDSTDDEVLTLALSDVESRKEKFGDLSTDDEVTTGPYELPTLVDDDLSSPKDETSTGIYDLPTLVDDGTSRCDGEDELDPFLMNTILDDDVSWDDDMHAKVLKDKNVKREPVTCEKIGITKEKKKAEPNQTDEFSDGMDDALYNAATQIDSDIEMISDGTTSPSAVKKGFVSSTPLVAKDPADVVSIPDSSASPLALPDSAKSAQEAKEQNHTRMGSSDVEVISDASTASPVVPSAAQKAKSGKSYSMVGSAKEDEPQETHDSSSETSSLPHVKQTSRKSIQYKGKQFEAELKVKPVWLKREPSDDADHSGTPAKSMGSTALDTSLIDLTQDDSDLDVIMQPQSPDEEREAGNLTVVSDESKITQRSEHILSDSGESDLLKDSSPLRENKTTTHKPSSTKGEKLRKRGCSRSSSGDSDHFIDRSPRRENENTLEEPEKIEKKSKQAQRGSSRDETAGDNFSERSPLRVDKTPAEAGILSSPKGDKTATNAANLQKTPERKHVSSTRSDPFADLPPDTPEKMGEDPYMMATQVDDSPYLAPTQVDLQFEPISDASLSDDEDALCAVDKDKGHHSSEDHEAERRPSDRQRVEKHRSRHHEHKHRHERSGFTDSRDAPTLFERMSSLTDVGLSETRRDDKSIESARKKMTDIKNRTHVARTVEIEALPESRRRGKRRGLHQKLCSSPERGAPEQADPAASTCAHGLAGDGLQISGAGSSSGGSSPSDGRSSADFQKHSHVPKQTESALGHGSAAESSSSNRRAKSAVGHGGDSERSSTAGGGSASVDDTWLSKKPEPMASKSDKQPKRRRKNAKSADEALPGIEEAKRRMAERNKLAIQNPMVVSVGKRRTSNQPADVDDDTDVELPSTQTVMELGLPTLNKWSLVDRKRFEQKEHDADKQRNDKEIRGDVAKSTDKASLSSEKKAEDRRGRSSREGSPATQSSSGVRSSKSSTKALHGSYKRSHSSEPSDRHHADARKRHREDPVKSSARHDHKKPKRDKTSESEHKSRDSAQAFKKPVNAGEKLGDGTLGEERSLTKNSGSSDRRSSHTSKGSDDRPKASSLSLPSSSAAALASSAAPDQRRKDVSKSHREHSSADRRPIHSGSGDASSVKESLNRHGLSSLKLAGSSGTGDMVRRPSAKPKPDPRTGDAVTSPCADHSPTLPCLNPGPKDPGSSKRGLDGKIPPGRGGPSQSHTPGPHPASQRASAQGPGKPQVPQQNASSIHPASRQRHASEGTERSTQQNTSSVHPAARQRHASQDRERCTQPNTSGAHSAARQRHASQEMERKAAQGGVSSNMVGTCAVTQRRASKESTKSGHSPQENSMASFSSTSQKRHASDETRKPGILMTSQRPPYPRDPKLNPKPPAPKSVRFNVPDQRPKPPPAQVFRPLQPSNNFGNWKQTVSAGHPNVPSHAGRPVSAIMGNQVDPQSLLKEDELMTRLLRWSPLWLEEYDKAREGVSPNSLPPIVDRSQLFPLVTMYEDVKEYQQICFVLMLLELWEEIFRDWKERKAKPPICHILFTERFPRQTNDELIKLGWKGLLTQDQHRNRQFPSEGDIVIMDLFGLDMQAATLAQQSGNSPTGKWVKQLAYVERVDAQECKNVDDLLSKWPPLVKHPAFVQKLDKLYIMNVTVKIRYRKFAPSNTEIMKLWSLGSVISPMRRFHALRSLPRSLLMRDILKPSRHVYYHQAPLTRQPQEPGSRFNPKQTEVISSIVSAVLQPPQAPRICLLQGPPGTGKSHVIIGMIMKILQNQPDAKICLAAPSNSAADELLKRLIRKRKESTSPNFSVLRIGTSTTFEVREYQWEVLVEKEKREELNRRKLKNVPKSVMTEYRRLQGKIRDTQEKLELYQRTDRTQRARYEQMLEDQKKEFAKFTRNIPSCSKDVCLDSREAARISEKVLLGANIVVGTLNSFGSTRIVNMLRRDGAEQNPYKSHFTCAIIDEATQATELDCLIPLQFGMTKLVLVGDPNQLPPTVLSMRAQALNYGLSMFERVYKYIQDDSSYGEASAVMTLETQYRMDPQICSFPNGHIYRGLLQTDRRVVENCKKYPLQPYCLFDVEEGQEQLSQSGSLCNELEAECTAILCEVLLGLGLTIQTQSIGIICPYASQKRLVSKRLAERGLRNIEVNTVDGFQGREKHIIILSCVRARSASGSIGFMADKRRMNVALTRAKYALYIVGHFESFMTDRDWKALIDDARRGDRNALQKVPNQQSFPDIIRKHCVKPQYQGKTGVNLQTQTSTGSVT